MISHFALALITLLACPKGPMETAVSEDPLAQRPEVSAPAPFTPAVPEAFDLNNGVGVWLVERKDLPLVSLRLTLDGGSALDPAAQPGLSKLTDTLITHGAGERDAEAFAQLLERQAIDLSVSTSPNTTVITLETHADRLDLALSLLADAVMRPHFDPKDLDRVREITLGELDQALDEPAVLSVWAGARGYWGEKHPFGHPGIGTRAALKAISAKDLRGSWTSRFNPKNASIVAAGAVSRAELSAALEKHLGAWTAGSAPALTLAHTPAADGPRLVFVDNPGASQSVLRVLMPGWTSTDEELLPARLGVIVLGGTFTSRLNRLLREEKGYTYGAKAMLDAGLGYGTVVAYTSVIQAATADALKDLLGQIELIAKGIRPEELEKAQGARRTAVVSSLETRSGITGTLATLEQNGQPSDALRQELSRLPSVTVEEVNTALSKVTLKGGVIVVVGDLSVIRAPVEAAVPGAWQTLSFGD